MLEHFIIEELRRRQKIDEEKDERPFLELPLPEYNDEENVKEETPEPKRVIIIDL